MILAFMFTMASIRLAILWTALSLPISSCMVQLLFLRKAKGNLRCPVHPLKQSITLWPIPIAKPFGSEAYYAIFRVQFHRLSYAVTIKLPCILLRIQSCHEHTKHIKIDCHFVRETLLSRGVITRYILTTEQLADIFTKELGHRQFWYLLSKLGASDPHAPN